MYADKFWSFFLIVIGTLQLAVRNANGEGTPRLCYRISIKYVLDFKVIARVLVKEQY